jgi:hypothetical protein
LPSPTSASTSNPFETTPPRLAAPLALSNINQTNTTNNQPTPNPNPETMKAALLLALYTLAAAALRTVAAGLA